MSTDVRILEAALRVFREEGVRGATTRRISQEAGVNEVTLFRRFGTKEQLLLAAMRHDAGHSAIPPAGRPTDPVEALTTWVANTGARLASSKGLIRASMEQLHEHPELCVQSQEAPTRIRLSLAGWFDQLRADGLARGDWDAVDVAKLLMGGMFGEVMRPDAPPSRTPEDLRAIAGAFARLVLRAVGAEVQNLEGAP